MRGLSDVLEAELAELATAGRLRACPELSGASRQRPLPSPAAAPLISFCSNDYLGLASHPEVVSAAAATASTEGFGAGAARLVAGDLPAHRALEVELARFLNREAALLFPTGYQTNLAVVTALAGPNDLIASDAANHASLIDGCRLSRATVEVFRHADPAAADAALSRPGSFRRRLLLTESLFSMDGDVPPLGALAEVAARHDAILAVDEAHAIGVLGPEGRGACTQAGIVPDVLIGTLGKALGSAGGFATGPRSLRAYLVNRARSFIFATAPPPPVAGAALAGLRIAAGPEGQRRRERLVRSRLRVTERLARAGHEVPTVASSPILPVIVGDDRRAVAASTRLRARGLFVPAIRPPTVPEGTARLRVTFSSEHTDDELDALAEGLIEVLS